MKRTTFCILALASLAAVAGCSGRRHRSRSEHPVYVTPAGHAVYSIQEVQIFQINSDGSPKWKSRDQIGHDMDSRIEEWVVQRSADGVRQPDRLRAVALAQKYHWYDDYRVATGSSPTGTATGIQVSGNIGCSIWEKGGPVVKAGETPPTAEEIRAKIPAGAIYAPWTVRYDEREDAAHKPGWYFGWLGRACPAVGHELDHVIGIDH